MITKKRQAYIWTRNILTGLAAAALTMWTIINAPQVAAGGAFGGWMGYALAAAAEQIQKERILAGHTQLMANMEKLRHTLDDIDA